MNKICYFLTGKKPSYLKKLLYNWKLHNCNYLANRLGGPTNFFSHAEQDKIFFDFIFKCTFSLWYLAIYWLEKVLSQCSHCIRFCWFSIKSSTALEVSNTPVLIVVKSVFFFFTTLLLVPSVFEVSRFNVLFKFTLKAILQG